jgi:ABC-type cobalamin/Fe3+-siderophores transport system ATPase subunit
MMAAQGTTAGFLQEPLLRGSLWRKWDLHVHAPSSVFNNQFAYLQDGTPDWDSYLESLENISDIAVLGITDYFSIDGYKKVRDHKSKGKLQNIDLILPNIELRLDLLIPTSKDNDNAQARKVNAHVIFSNEVAPEDIVEHFLLQLKFAALGHTQAKSELCSLTRYQLEQFGQRLKQEHPSFTKSDYEVGCMNASIDFELIKEVLLNHRSVFENKYLIVVASENLSLISWNGQGHQLRKTLIRGSDAIFGNSSDRDWLLGRKHNNTGEFVHEFGSLKPCLQGSDAHSINDIGRPREGRYCWIKSDPTFEGLRQVIFEPSDRLFLGDEPPKLKRPYRVLSSVRITNAPDWFSYTPIPLNPDLVSIIGGKGAGKSALAELIAYAGGTEFFRSQKPKDLQDTFLAKASKRTQSNLKPITNAKIQLIWADGEEEEHTLSETLDHGLSEEKVKYLPQKFVERICAPENHADLLREMERVIFHRIPRADRLGASTFSDLRDHKTKSIKVKKANLEDNIATLNRNVYVAFERVSSKEQKAKLLADLRKELTELLKHRPDTTAINAVDLDQLKSLQLSLQKLQNQVATHQSSMAIVDEIEAKFASMKSRLESFNQDIGTLLTSIGMADKAAAFAINLPGEYLDLLASKRTQLSEAIEELRSNSGTESSITSTSLKITKATEALNLSQSKRAAFEKFETDRSKLEEQIEALETEIKTIESTLEAELFQQRQLRVEKYLDYFAILKEEKKALDGLYAPLRVALEAGGDTDKKLQFQSRVSFDAAAHASNGAELFDNRRRGKFKDQELLHAELKKLMAELEAIDFDRDLSKRRILEFRETFLLDVDDKPITIGEQIRRNKTEEDFNNWFYSLSPYGVEYSITFEGRDLSLLSPGQKGIVLLLVYLEVDQDDQRPLIIDQPEDNLDNLSVYENLIQFFRTRKLFRQIILITHNPNLVVNTDSEQIIIATYQGERNPKIGYRSGALEETSIDPQGIRQKVCAILEGGTEAFQRREQKYSFT